MRCKHSVWSKPGDVCAWCEIDRLTVMNKRFKWDLRQIELLEVRNRGTRTLKRWLVARNDSLFSSLREALDVAYGLRTFREMADDDNRSDYFAKPPSSTWDFRDSTESVRRHPEGRIDPKERSIDIDTAREVDGG